jgi:hypothetical protein
MVGVSLDGTAFYSGLTADGYDAVAYALFDTCGGRPDESGTYHFHQESSCLLNRFSEGSGSTLLGYALDGFGMFSSVENGAKLTNDSLDVCHGHEHVILWDGVPQNMYHYHMTDEYPYTISCFKGTPTVPAAAPIEETVDALSFPEEVTGTSSTSLESE